MKASAIAHLSSSKANHNANNLSCGKTIPLPPPGLVRLLPALSPMYPLIPNVRPVAPPAPGQNPFNSVTAPRKDSNCDTFSYCRGTEFSRFKQQANRSNFPHCRSNSRAKQNNRKQYFLPYMNKDSGKLRISSNKHDEAYVDIGDDNQDILVLGIQDRNRALHGDIVVVRIKERERWAVRDVLYFAWREGKLNERMDDDGQLITVPPVKLATNNFICHTSIASFKSNCDGNYDKNIAVSSNFVTIIRQNGNGGDNCRFNRRLLMNMSSEDWGMPDLCLQKTAEVVFIVEKRNCRAAVGILKNFVDKNRNFALFLPIDSRIPRMVIPVEEIPNNLFDQSQLSSRFIYLANIAEWNIRDRNARGKLYKRLGVMGDLDAETEGLLFTNNIDTREFSPAVLSSLPITENVDWKIDEKEFKYRRDFRDETVFAIESSAIHDRDFAMHLRRLQIENNHGPIFEVGVHVPDVSHFVQPGTELDNWAASRVTSIRLVQKIIPMLPKILTDDLCLLKPGIIRLTFSVLLKIDENGKICSIWFGRSIVQLNRKFTNETAEIAKQFRTKRLGPHFRTSVPPKFELKLERNNDLCDDLLKIEYSNVDLLMDEFKILTNMYVARKILYTFPEIAILKKQEIPKRKGLLKVLKNIVEQCVKLFDSENGLCCTFADCINGHHASDDLAVCFKESPIAQIYDALQPAYYYAGGVDNNYADFKYSVPVYTNFTSPCTRYPDIMVHRLLSGALRYSLPPGLLSKELKEVLDYCNEKCQIATNIEEANFEMFFSSLITRKGPMVLKAIVVGLFKTHLNVVLSDYGWIKAIFYNSMRKTLCEARFQNGYRPTLILYWPSLCDQNDNEYIKSVIRLGSIVDIILAPAPDSNKYIVTLKAPETREFQ
ncbi:unnamed protein product [Dracunculus medinensis]|uniref:RNB domain-containing protein n=1 Tax=Dracunculus medinensis TaxID=318479 RepID=A0A0N4UHE2_DRAME|nr:unnamed protein product [Dracunculus medinensis]